MSENIEMKKNEYGKWVESKKHIWQKDEDGDIDIFAYSQGYCNGVVCVKCGKSYCCHCTPDYDETECKEVHFICSKCGEESLSKTSFCPHCGDYKGE